ncbi:M1 family metallopeptidase [Ideonella sp. A 288]|uniref:M1 family metallopeptidase n=1 Tax=Ideonella sp. A 288 TaxID=1962181 RepID=UPI000B4BDEAA|nr:M1 family aminopeptidase [Ideonella sp. A 288]
MVHHDLRVVIDPANHRLRVRDRVRIPASLVDEHLTLTLHAGLALQPVAGGLVLVRMGASTEGAGVGLDREDHARRGGVPVAMYRVQGAVPGRELVGEIAYEGVVHHPVAQQGAAYSRGSAQSPGLIEPRGVFLAGATHWVPQVGHALITYTLQTDLPTGWKTVSQGQRGEVAAGAPDRAYELWTVPTPTEEVHLIAARFTEYSRDAGGVQAQAFLRTPDAALADRYLGVTAQYLALFSGLLGPYPYPKFALVENFWETGYGMPSFTLLGEQVIRFPFILHSSYPHELLHNWWGNGVYVDFATGNWCEGLTSYLADHLIAEQRGQGAEHRRDILQRVSDHVTADNDFPLSRFQGRTDAVTEAVGYGKTAMMFNMLREKIGDARFIEGLRAYYREHRFTVAGFDDLRRSFEAAGGQPLGPFFDQWVRHPGVPELQLEAATASGQRLELTLAQVQRGRRFALDVPVAIQTDAGIELKLVSMPADQARVSVGFDLLAPARRVEVDPQFQIYRRLNPLETPPTLSKAFGAGRVLIVTPAEGADTYAGLLKAWRKPGVEVVVDSALEHLPADRAVWVLGARNKFVGAVAAGLDAPASLRQGVLQVGDARHGPDTRGMVAAVRHPRDPALVRVYLSAPSEAAAAAMARKLPHYGKYSWAVFAGDEAAIEARGEWPVHDTPLARSLVPGAGPIRLVPRPALAAPAAAAASVRP